MCYGGKGSTTWMSAPDTYDMGLFHNSTNTIHITYFIMDYSRHSRLSNPILKQSTDGHTSTSDLLLPDPMKKDQLEKGYLSNSNK
jgi:hypothetical protein